MLCQGLAAAQKLSPNLWKKCAEANGCSSGGGSIRGDWGSEWDSFFCKSWMMEVMAHIPPHSKVRAGPRSVFWRTSVCTGHTPDGLCTLCGCQSAVAAWLISLRAPCCNGDRHEQLAEAGIWNGSLLVALAPQAAAGVIAPHSLQNSRCAAGIGDEVGQWGGWWRRKCLEGKQSSRISKAGGFLSICMFWLT